MRCFHPSKEGFKVISRPSGFAEMASFHPSKEGFKADPIILSAEGGLCFHPSKEGFKGRPYWRPWAQRPSFHPSKEGFKALWGRTTPTGIGVSIPLRKVSRPLRNVGTHVFIV